MFEPTYDPASSCRTVTWAGALRAPELVAEAEERVAAVGHRLLLVDYRLANLGLLYDEAWMVTQRLKAIAVKGCAPERAAVLLSPSASDEQRLVYRTLAEALPVKAEICFDFAQARNHLGLPGDTSDPRLAA